MFKELVLTVGGNADPFCVTGTACRQLFLCLRVVSGTSDGTKLHKISKHITAIFRFVLFGKITPDMKSNMP